MQSALAAWLSDQVGQPVTGLRHERGVHRTDTLVEQQDLRLDGGHHTQRQAHAHTGGVGAQRHGEVVTQLGEFGDVVHLLLHLFAAGLELGGGVGVGEVNFPAGDGLDDRLFT